MFDVGFFEVLLVGIVALCLFGPEELLVFAKSIGRWIGRLRRMKHKLLEEMRDIERHSSQHD